MYTFRVVFFITKKGERTMSKTDDLYDDMDFQAQEDEIMDVCDYIHGRTLSEKLNDIQNSPPLPLEESINKDKKFVL